MTADSVRISRRTKNSGNSEARNYHTAILSRDIKKQWVALNSGNFYSRFSINLASNSLKGREFFKVNQLVTQTSKLDKSVARVIKLLSNEAKPGKEIPEKFESIISDTVGQLNSTLRVAFTAVIEKEQPDRETLQEWIVTLKQWGWVLASTEIFLHWEQSFIEEELLSIINLAPSERALKSWLKSTNSETLELLLAENLDLAFSTYGADWSLSLKKFDKKITLVDRLFGKAGKA